MILLDTLGCYWQPSQFLIFSDLNVFGPLVYYSHLFAFVTATGLGLFVYFGNRNSLSAKLFSTISLLFSIWIFSDLVLWANENPDLIMFFWTITILVEPVIYALGLYFLLVYLNKNLDVSKKAKSILFLILVPTIIFCWTRLGILGFNYTNCDREVVEGILVYYGYAVEIFLTLWAVVATMRAYRSASIGNRKPIILTALGILAFFFTFAWGNIVGTISEDWTLGQYGLFGMPILFAFMTYSIVKFKTFNIKLLGAQALVATLSIVMASILFIRHIENIRVVLIPSLLLVFILGYFLVRGVEREVRQREELARLNAELGAANEKLQVLDEQKSQFVSFASHDLKSPINIIKQFATLIADGTYKEPAKVQETIVKIKSTADRATQMVDDFLDIRKIEEGKMDYNFEVKDIVSFVKGIAEDYAPVAKAQKNIIVSFITTTPEIQVKMDSTRLRQVIQNYLNNSVKYTDTANGKPNWIKVMVTDEQSTVLISIKDSGMGLRTELIPTLFEQFHRDKNTAKKIQGTGLGLFISKQIVLGHAGETWAQSDGEGKGSTFFVRLKKA